MGGGGRDREIKRDFAIPPLKWRSRCRNSIRATTPQVLRTFGLKYLSSIMLSRDAARHGSLFLIEFSCLRS